MSRPAAIVIVLALLSTSALAQEESVRTPVEPGTLSSGAFGVEAGFGIGGGPPPGFGADLVVGLGGLDLFAGASVIPGICILDSCSPATALVGGGAQARLLESADGRTRLGLRGSFDIDPSQSDRYMATGAVQVATGSTRHRFVLEALAVYDHSAASGDAEVILAAVPGYELLGRNLGLFVGIGPAIETGTNEVLPAFRADLMWR
jgi:hypothetical protein